MCVLGGQVIILEGALQHNKTGPFRAIVLDITMLMHNPGRERTVGEYKLLTTKAGFKTFSFQAVEGTSHYDVFVARKT